MNKLRYRNHCTAGTVSIFCGPDTLLQAKFVFWLLLHLHLSSERVGITYENSLYSESFILWELQTYFPSPITSVSIRRSSEKVWIQDDKMWYRVFGCIGVRENYMLLREVF